MSESEFSTEWGVKSPWGFNSHESRAFAERVVENMKQAGHDASLVWRGTTPWHYAFSDERAMQPAE